jgi:hypothetical protein
MIFPLLLSTKTIEPPLAHGHYVTRFYRLLESNDPAARRVMVWVQGDSQIYDRFKVLSWEELWRIGIVKTTTRYRTLLENLPQAQNFPLNFDW